MLNREKIAVVMATFNGIKFIKEQLDSLRLQTLEPDEVIICDDASSDGTFEFLNIYVAQYQLCNWHIMKNQENIGWIMSFYKLFDLTTCDIIFCADQDDIWLNNKIELMSNVVSLNPNIKVLGGNNIKVGADGKANKSMLKKSKNIKNEKITKIAWNGKFYLTHRPGCALCFRKEMLCHANNIRTEFYPHDQLLWNIACVLDSAYIISTDVILQRRHSESAMIKKKKINNRVLEIKNTLKIITILLNYFTDSVLINTEKLATIKEVEKFFELRINFMNQLNLKSGFKLLKYLAFYPRYRTYFADLKYVLECHNSGLNS